MHFQPPASWKAVTARTAVCSSPGQPRRSCVKVRTKIIMMLIIINTVYESFTEMASSQASTGCILHPAIMINCAFARVAFRELSHETPDERTTHFKELFCQYPGFHLPDSYFTQCNGKKNPSQFEKDLTRINKAFSSKWNPPCCTTTIRVPICNKKMDSFIRRLKAKAFFE